MLILDDFGLIEFLSWTGIQILLLLVGTQECTPGRTVMREFRQ